MSRTPIPPDLVKHPTTVYLRDDIKKRATDEAHRLGMSFSNFISFAIVNTADYLDATGKKRGGGGEE